MSDNDDKKNDKKSGSDPYDFFKLSSEPGDSNKGGKGKGPKIPFWAIIIIIIAITGILNVLLVPRQENLIAFISVKRILPDTWQFLKKMLICPLPVAFSKLREKANL